MKLLSVNTARSVWLINLIDFNPRGKSLFSAIPEIVATYKFVKYPNIAEIDFQKGLVFEDGEFQNKDGDRVSIKMTIFNDGLVVDSRSSTEDTDDFLQDMLTRITELFNLPSYEPILRKRNYLSELYVSTDKSLEIVNPKLTAISEYLTNNISGYDDVSFELSGIHFWPDQIQATNPSPFILERTLRMPFSENRYFSVAALKTEQHLELLNMLEELIAS